MNKTSLALKNKTANVLSPTKGILQRKCACGNKTVASGECTECAKKKNGLQLKLAIGASNDSLEREADRVAAQVLAMPTNSNIGRTPPRIQRLTGQSVGQTATAPASVDRILASSGRPLEPVLRQDMEQRFGYDFSRVRVHTGKAAEQSARDVNAYAYTAGHNVVFGEDRFSPGTNEGKRLLAHELTHVIQQDGSGLHDRVQADFAVEPTKPAAVRHILSATEITDAIAFNTRTITDAQEIELLRDILGLNKAPATVDADFVQAVADYQTQFGLAPDGKVGPRTRRRLSREILAESRFLGFSKLGGLATGVALRTQLAGLISAGNRNYATFRTRIRAATVLQRDVILAEPTFLTQLRNHLTTWNDFARCVELLGRRAPTHNQLIRRTVVRNGLAAAWTASNPAVNPPATTQHEEGGWVYLNLITNVLTVRRQAAGAGAAINLAAPPIIANSIVVAKFHTHPNLGPGWIAGPSGQDAVVDAAHGVPDIVIGSNDVNAATFNTFSSGPNRRLHLAGNQGLPGAAGGVAPQARADGA